MTQQSLQNTQLLEENLNQIDPELEYVGVVEGFPDPGDIYVFETTDDLWVQFWNRYLVKRSSLEKPQEHKECAYREVDWKAVHELIGGDLEGMVETFLENVVEPRRRRFKFSPKESTLPAQVEGLFTSKLSPDETFFQREYSFRKGLSLEVIYEQVTTALQTALTLEDPGLIKRVLRLYETQDPQVNVSFVLDQLLAGVERMQSGGTTKISLGGKTFRPLQKEIMQQYIAFMEADDTKVGARRLASMYQDFTFFLEGEQYCAETMQGLMSSVERVTRASSDTFAIRDFFERGSKYITTDTWSIHRKRDKPSQKVMQGLITYAHQTTDTHQDPEIITEALHIANILKTIKDEGEFLHALGVAESCFSTNSPSSQAFKTLRKRLSTPRFDEEEKEAELKLVCDEISWGNIEQVVNTPTYLEQARKKRKSVLIVGLGNTGAEIADILASDPDNALGVEKLYISNRSKNNANDIKEYLETEIRISNSPFEIEVVDFDELDEVKNKVATVIVSAGQSGSDREKLFEQNLPVIRRVAEQFKGYQGSVIVVTNPSDAMATAFTHYSQLDPRQVVGSNYVDTLRYQFALRKEFGTQDVEGFVIGPHDEKRYIPVLSQTKVNGKSLTQEDVEMVQKACEAAQNYAPYVFTKLGKFGGTRKSVAKSIYGVVKALFNEQDSVVMSTYGGLNEFVEADGDLSGSVHIGYPVRFSNFRANPVKQKLDAQETLRFCSAYRDGIQQVKLITEGIR